MALETRAFSSHRHGGEVPLQQRQADGEVYRLVSSLTQRQDTGSSKVLSQRNAIRAIAGVLPRSPCSSGGDHPGRTRLANVPKRLKCHGTHYGTNFLMNLFEAILGRQSPDIQQFVVYSYIDQHNVAMAEIVFSRLTKGYGGNAGGSASTPLVPAWSMDTNTRQSSGRRQRSWLSIICSCGRITRSVDGPYR